MKCRKAETATTTTAAEQNINSTTPSTSGTRQGHVGPHVSTPRISDSQDGDFDSDEDLPLALLK